MSVIPFVRPSRRCLLAVIALLGVFAVAGPLTAAPLTAAPLSPPGIVLVQHGKGHGHHRCLRGGEMRRAVGAGEAKPLGAIMRHIGGGEIVRAMLCRTPRGLVYRLAVLKGARVEELIVDARSGRVLRRR